MFGPSDFQARFADIIIIILCISYLLASVWFLYCLTIVLLSELTGNTPLQILQIFSVTIVLYHYTYLQIHL